MSRLSDLQQTLPTDITTLQFPHRPACDLETIARRYPLIDYVAKYGVEIHQLERHYLTTLLVARNCEGLLDSLHHTPLATDVSQREAVVAKKQPNQSLSQGAAKARHARSPSAADHSHIRKLERLSDIGRALPSELARMVTMPELFINRVATRQLDVREYLEKDTAASQKKSAAQEVLATGNPTALTQRALVLVDVTKSMDTRDSRGVVAAGLGLCYLRRAAERGGALHLAPFTTHLREIFSGEGTEGLARLAKELLNLQNSGVTNIQRSLEEAADTILQRGEFEHDDILLLTDGLSRLTERPASMRRLHTFLLGNHEERTERGLRDMLELRKQRSTLMGWSETFEELKGDELRELTTLTAADFAQLRDLAYRYLGTFDGNSGEHKRVLSAIQHLLSNARLADASLSELSGEIDRAIHPTRWQLPSVSSKDADVSGSSNADQANAPTDEPVEYGASGESSSGRLRWGKIHSPGADQTLLFKRIYDLFCAWGKKVSRLFSSRG